jgi:hypothetical protein
MLTKLGLLITFLLFPTFLSATNYYIDSAVGLDTNSGTSPGEPWKTLEKVNAFKFQPGDSILFKRGLVWLGQLVPISSGVEGRPIVIDCYGTGKMPRIDAEGKVEDAVKLYNVQQIELRHLEVTNLGDKPAPIRRGVHIFLENYGVARHIIISGLYVHHVNSTNQRKETGGIVFTTQGTTTPSRFDGLTIERNIVWKVDRSAIVAQSSHSQRRRWNPSTNVVIRDNYVADVGGDGIVPWATDGCIIEHNIAFRCNQRGENYNAAIWPWSTDNTLIQLN